MFGLRLHAGALAVVVAPLLLVSLTGNIVSRLAMSAEVQLDVSGVTIIDMRPVIRRGVDDVVLVSVTGRVRHSFSQTVTIRLETTVYDAAGKFLGAYAFFMNDDIPPQTERGFNNPALGYDPPAGTVVGRVDVKVIRVLGR